MVHMRIRGLLVSFFFLVVAPALAQTQQQIDWCNGKDGYTPDLQIGGCTALIQSGKYTEKQLAIVFMHRGSGYVEKGQHDRAIQDFDHAIKLDPNIAGAFNGRGQAYADQGQYDRAIQDYDHGTKLDPSNSYPFRGRGDAYYNKGQYDRAIQNYDQAIKLNPYYVKAYYGRSLAKEKKGDTAGAAADLATARSRDPNIGKK